MLDYELVAFSAPLRAAAAFVLASAADGSAADITAAVIQVRHSWQLSNTVLLWRCPIGSPAAGSRHIASQSMQSGFCGCDKRTHRRAWQRLVGRGIASWSRSSHALTCVPLPPGCMRPCPAPQDAEDPARCSEMAKPPT